MVENTSVKFDYIFSINKAQYTSLLIQILLKQNKILEKKKKKEQPLPSYYYSSVII